MPIISSYSGLPIYEDKNKEKSLAFGYSPERINPGDKEHKKISSNYQSYEWKYKECFILG